MRARHAACGLILPALATRWVVGVRGLWAGYAIGIAGYASGILLSAVFDLPTGAVVVFTLAVCALIAGRMMPRSV